MTNILDKLEELVMIGDEKSARSFLAEHINEFPPDVKKKFVFALFMEAVENETKVNELQAQAIDQGLKELKEARKDTQNIDDKLRLLDLKKKINGIK